MKASELRINNLILTTKDSNKDYVVTKVSGVIIDYVEFELILSKPIPLTKEWLLKFGFKAKSINHNFTIDSDIDFQISSGQRVIQTNERSSFYLQSIFGTKINYVHQLQNLYFALTGEELTLNQES